MVCIRNVYISFVLVTIIYQTIEFPFDFIEFLVFFNNGGIAQAHRTTEPDGCQMHPYSICIRY